MAGGGGGGDVIQNSSIHVLERMSLSVFCYYIVFATDFARFSTHLYSPYVADSRP